MKAVDMSISLNNIKCTENGFTCLNKILNVNNSSQSYRVLIPNVEWGPTRQFE